ncbi:hypothetical protein KC872_00325, partial [Candidatus Kaiserbacteria bacterium]|nr:hypothetical protein [Candidatus Kaiserbacteria bacterium]
MEEPEINPVEYSKWAFKIMVGFVGVICLMVFTPLSGHLSNLFANTPVPNTTLIATLQSFQCGQSTVQDADANTY